MVSMGIVTLRPHHLLCVRFRPAEFPDRPGKFLETERTVKAVINPESGVMIRVAEGMDFLCEACPNCADGRCNDPRADEEMVRIWDATILNNLGASYGTTMTAHDWGDVILRKAPLEFCVTQCPARSECPGPAGETG